MLCGLAVEAMVVAVKTSLALSVSYPYEEFSDHVKAMKTVREWEYTARFGHLGTCQSSRANNARIVEYFSDSYADQREAVYKAELFLLINDYLGRNAKVFSKKGLMDEAEDGMFSVEPALLRAVHYVFTAAIQPASTPPAKVLTLAKAIQDIAPAG